MSVVEISVALEQDCDAWQAFVRSHEDRSVFHDFRWAQVLRESFGFRTYFLIARQLGMVVGVCPLAEVKTYLFGHSLVSLPFCHYAGPLVNDEAVSHLLVSRTEALGRELGVQHVEIRSLGKAVSDWASNASTYVTFRKTIAETEDACMLEIPRKQRAMVRKGIKAELTLEKGTPAQFHSVYSDNMHRHGSPTYSRRYFEVLLKVFGNEADIQLVKSKEGSIVSGVLSLYDDREAFPIYAGDLPEARAVAGNDFKYWQLMQFVRERGKKTFNYGRSKRETGSFDFKKNWGFLPTDLVYQYKLLKRDDIPSNNPQNPKYQLLIKIWRLLPRWLVNFIGPILVKGLG
jgi:FemAB-related protein (PEP-CTERM system-associated)